MTEFKIYYGRVGYIIWDGCSVNPICTVHWSNSTSSFLFLVRRVIQNSDVPVRRGDFEQFNIFTVSIKMYVF